MDLSKIKAFAFDIDGVATDGGILCNTDGDFLRVYDAKDGFAVRMACMNAYEVAVITGGRSKSIMERFKASGVKAENIYLHSRDKMDDFGKFCEKYALQPDEVMYFGDDIPDVELMKACGIGVCPSDAVPEAKAAADFISSRPGGKGCLREGIEMVMRAQGRWLFETSLYKKLF